jgi:hypothetical protein
LSFSELNLFSIVFFDSAQLILYSTFVPNNNLMLKSVFLRALTVLTFVLLGWESSSYAQVGIGTSTPASSSALDVTSSNKGFLPPRISLTSVTDNSTINSPSTGLLIYNTATAGSAPNNVVPGYYFWNGSKWTIISTLSGNSTGVAKFFNNSTQAYTGSAMNVAFNSTELNSINSFVTLSSNGIVLEPGIYELEGSVGGIASTSTGDGRAYSGFYNNTTSSYIGQGGQSASGNAGNHNGLAYNAATALIQVTSTTTVYLKISNGINLGSISTSADYGVAALGRAWVIIRKYQ